MADIVVSIAKRLAGVLLQEADLLLGVHEEVQSLKNLLDLVHPDLRRFERSRYDQERVKNAVHQIRDLAYQAEDVVDTYVAYVVQSDRDNFIKAAAYKFGKILTRREVAKKISAIKTRIREVHDDINKFGIQLNQSNIDPDDQAAATQRTRPRLPIEDIDVVGFDNEVTTIVDRIIGGGPKRDTIPIVGMGGIGKTTLAKRVFNNPIIVHNFPFRAWVCLPQYASSVRDLLLAIMKASSSHISITENMIKEMSDADLELELQKRLLGMRYLIVLDDVWETDFWEEWSHIFPNNLHKSRIILTTRKNEVALHVNPSTDPHQVKYLTNDECWELLHKKMFKDGECPSKLKELGVQIAAKCGGLPLAVVVLAGVLLKRRKNEEERTIKWWSNVLATVNAILAEPESKCSKILALSYDDLPLHLRPCFLYLSLFPQDYEIDAGQLIRIWIAEGFIRERENVMMEDIAEEYLEDLIDRNLIQVVRKKFDGAVRSCGIHDLLRDLCIAKAEQDNFSRVIHGQQKAPLINCRRVGIHFDTTPDHIITGVSSKSKFRSFMCLGRNNDKLTPQHWKILKKVVSLVKVLDLLGLIVDGIPDEIGKLICLRYLRLRSPTASHLPQSISNLWNLETLQVIAPCINRPSLNIWKMKQLRHLCFGGQLVLPDPPNNMATDDCLTNLQTIDTISPDSCKQMVFSKMPNLVMLGVYGDLESHKDLVFENLSRLNHLLVFKLVRDRRYCALTSLPDLVQFPPSLSVLTLSETQLSDDPMEKLGQIPNLRVLKLKNDAIFGGELNCTTTSGFPQLEVLKLKNLGITKLHMSNESMPSLQSLTVDSCGSLDGLPSSSLLQKTAFQELKLGSPNDAVAECAGDIKLQRGQHFNLIRINN